jgi:hypothetical protein
MSCEPSSDLSSEQIQLAYLGLHICSHSWRSARSSLRRYALSVQATPPLRMGLKPLIGVVFNVFW